MSLGQSFIQKEVNVLRSYRFRGRNESNVLWQPVEKHIVDETSFKLEF